MWEYYLIDVLTSISAVMSVIGFFGVGALVIDLVFCSRIKTFFARIIAIALLIAVLTPSKESLELMLLGY